MYAVAVNRSFSAGHFLVGGDWGVENSPHSHDYKLEVTLEGQELGQHGYLVDIVDIEANLDDLLDRYRDHTLNDLTEFSGLNPSIENFARIFCLRFAEHLRNRDNLTALTVKVWEDRSAWASYRLEL